MLTANQLRQAARQVRRDITHIETDVLLTYLLEMFVERGLTNDLAFKGGTMLRKMVFGRKDASRPTSTSLSDRSEISMMLSYIYSSPLTKNIVALGFGRSAKALSPK
jgi:hypothetical protein